MAQASRDPPDRIKQEWSRWPNQDCGFRRCDQTRSSGHRWLALRVAYAPAVGRLAAAMATISARRRAMRDRVERN